MREGDVPTGELGRGVFCQIVEDKLDQSVGIVLARLRKRDDLRYDDFRHRVAHIESERELNVVLAEMFGTKGNYNDPEIEAACDVLNAREEANG